MRQGRRGDMFVEVRGLHAAALNRQGTASRAHKPHRHDKRACPRRRVRVGVHTCFRLLGACWGRPGHGGLPPHPQLHGRAAGLAQQVQQVHHGAAGRTPVHTAHAHSRNKAAPCSNSAGGDTWLVPFPPPPTQARLPRAPAVLAPPSFAWAPTQRPAPSAGRCNNTHMHAQHTQQKTTQTTQTTHTHGTCWRGTPASPAPPGRPRCCWRGWLPGPG
jgi:hypothetical protein